MSIVVRRERSGSYSVTRTGRDSGGGTSTSSYSKAEAKAAGIKSSKQLAEAEFQKSVEKQEAAAELIRQAEEQSAQAQQSRDVQASRERTQRIMERGGYNDFGTGRFVSRIEESKYYPTRQQYLNSIDAYYDFGTGLDVRRPEAQQEFQKEVVSKVRGFGNGRDNRADTVPVVVRRINPYVEQAQEEVPRKESFGKELLNIVSSPLRGAAKVEQEGFSNFLVTPKAKLSQTAVDLVISRGRGVTPIEKNVSSLIRNPSRKTALRFVGGQAKTYTDTDVVNLGVVSGAALVGVASPYTAFALRGAGAYGVGFFGAKAIAEKDVTAAATATALAAGEVVPFIAAKGQAGVYNAAYSGLSYRGMPQTTYSAPRWSMPRFTTSLGKKGAVFRGGERISPQSKAQLRKQSLGYQSKISKGYRVSESGNEVVVSSRDPAVREYFEKQLGFVGNNGAKSRAPRVSEIESGNFDMRKSGLAGSEYKQNYNPANVNFPSGLKEVRVRGQPPKYKLTESGERVLFRKSEVSGIELVLKRGGTQLDSIMPKKFFVKGTRPGKPIYEKETTLAGSNQLLKGLQERPADWNTPYPQQAKTIRINDQKMLTMGDPSRSRYAAKNILSDVRTDVNVPAYQSGSQSLRGGFRKAGMREQIFARARAAREAQVAEIDAPLISERNSLFKDLSNADLKPVQTEFVRSLPAKFATMERGKTGVEVGSLLRMGSSSALLTKESTDVSLMIGEKSESGVSSLPRTDIASAITSDVRQDTSVKPKTDVVMKSISKVKIVQRPKATGVFETPFVPEKIVQEKLTQERLVGEKISQFKFKDTKRRFVDDEDEKRRKRNTEAAQQARKVEGGYATFIKSRGVKRLAGSGLSRTAALDLGATLTKRGLGASFEIRRTSAPVRVRQGTGAFARSASEFREYRIVKGQKVTTPGTFIQKRGFRLGTKSERTAIQYAKRRLL